MSEYFVSLYFVPTYQSNFDLSQTSTEVFFRFEANELGGIAGEGFDNGKRHQRNSERRYTVTLLEILRDRAKAPIEIDYLSLDVEGMFVYVSVFSFVLLFVQCWLIG